MAEYLVELYAARGDEHGVQVSAEALQAACHRLTSEGEDVRYVRSIFVPEDETSFSLCEASSVDVVRRAVALAGLGHAHVASAVALPVRTGAEGTPA